MNEDLPPWVQFVNDAVKGVSDKIDQMVARFATQSDIAMLKYQIEQERQNRTRDDRDLSNIIKDLKAELASDEADRKAKNRRFLVAVWSVAGTLMLVMATLGVAFIHG